MNTTPIRFAFSSTNFNQLQPLVRRKAFQPISTIWLPPVNEQRIFIDFGFTYLNFSLL